MSGRNTPPPWGGDSSRASKLFGAPRRSQPMRWINKPLFARHSGLPVKGPPHDASAMEGPHAFIDRNTPVLIGRLRRLVGIPTVNPPGENYDAVTGYLTRELER